MSSWRWRWLVIVGLALAPRLAAADWYYRVSCADRCGEALPAIEHRGPFASYGACEAQREHAAHNGPFADEHVGWTGFCEAHDDPPRDFRTTAWSWRPWEMERSELSVMGGGAWQSTDPNSGSVGASLELISGRHPELAFESTIGAMYAVITPVGNPALVPILMVGLTSSPLLDRGPIVETRLAAGADVGWLRGDLGWMFHGGVDLYLGATKSDGVGIEVVVFSSNTLHPPAAIVRLSWIRRTTKVWW